MKEAIQTVLDKIQTLSQHLTGIGEKEPVLQEFSKNLNDMPQILQQLSDDSNTDKTREMLAGFRFDLSRMIKEIDRLMTDSAEVYRLSIGARKDQFELLSDIEQQNVDPQAYRTKNVFRQLADCKDHIRLLTAGIMDLEGSLEHEQLAQKGLTPSDSINADNLGASSDQPSLSP